MLYPNGVELTLELAPRIASLLSRRTVGLAEYMPADLTFGNLWLFRREHRWRWHDDIWPYISGLTYDGQGVALPLFDVRNAPANILRDLAHRYGALFPVTQREAEVVQDAGFALANESADADYVYRAEAFRTYRGRVLRKKANLMRQLLAAHAVNTEAYTPDLREAALSVLNGWMKEKGKASGDADEAACKDALAHAAELQLQGFVHNASGKPAGFLLAEALKPGVWAIRFAKGLARYKGIAQYMFHHFACSGGSSQSPVVDWINFEQDLGLSNFQQTKNSYQPAFLLPKWRILPGRQEG